MSYDPNQQPYQPPVSGQPYPPPQGYQPPPQPHAAPAPWYGPGSPYGPVPPYNPNVPKQKRAQWPYVLLGIAVLIAGCLVLAAMGNFNSDDPAESRAAAKPAAKMNEPTRDGKFEFTVTDVKCGLNQVGSGFLSSKPQGEFCIVTVKVSNIGKEAQSFSGSDQKALDAKGVEYSNDGAAEFDANSGTPTWSEQINPGNKVVGKLVYDVPPGTKLTAILLHDSVFSGGVKVSLA